MGEATRSRPWLPHAQMELDENGDAARVVPLYSFDFKSLNLSTTCAPAAGAFPCTTPEGEGGRGRAGRMHHSPLPGAPAWEMGGQSAGPPQARQGHAPGSRCCYCRPPPGAANWTNAGRLYGNAERIYGNTSAGEYTVPCTDGSQRWQNVSSAAAACALPAAPALLPRRLWGLRAIGPGHAAVCRSQFPSYFPIFPCQLVYVGWNFTVPEELRDYSIKGAFNAPARLHIGEGPGPPARLAGGRGEPLHASRSARGLQGSVLERPFAPRESCTVLGGLSCVTLPYAGNIGLAPAIGVTATSAVPMRTGGNFDQRRLGKGATLYLPVEVGGWEGVPRAARFVGRQSGRAMHLLSGEVRRHPSSAMAATAAAAALVRPPCHPANCTGRGRAALTRRWARRHGRRRGVGHGAGGQPERPPAPDAAQAGCAARAAPGELGMHRGGTLLLQGAA